MSPGRAIIAGALVGILIAGCGAGSHHHPRSHPVRPARSPVEKPTAIPAPDPNVLALDAVLSVGLASAGPHSGALVYDLTAARPLFALRDTVARPPASLEKLYTTVAVLKDLGSGALLQTTVLGAGQLSPGKVWEGDLYLRGGGDPTFGDGSFNQIWEDGYGPTAAELAAQLRGDGIRRVSGEVVGDASLFDMLPGAPNSGYAPDLPDLGGELSALAFDHGAVNRRLGPAAFATHELVLTMHDAGIRARAASVTASAPSGARVLASVSSPPILVLVRLMDVPSDDFFAEMLAKQLGVRFGGGGSTTAGAAVIADAIAALGLHPAIVDGSGLSRADRSSPGQVVGLLRTTWGTTIGSELRASLPLLGVNGSARGIARRTPAAGRCSVKTGTLNYVSNLAGYCRSRGGHTLAFALFLDGPSNTRAFVLIGQMAAAIAAY